MGFPDDTATSLPDFTGRLRWIPGHRRAQADLAPAFTFVLWDDQKDDPCALTIDDPERASIVVVLHRQDHAPPALANGQHLGRMPYGGQPLDALLALVAPLLMPLVYRSTVCVDISDFEFLFGHGGGFNAWRKPGAKTSSWR